MGTFYEGNKKSERSMRSTLRRNAIEKRGNLQTGRAGTWVRKLFGEQNVNLNNKAIVSGE